MVVNLIIIIIIGQQLASALFLHKLSCLSFLFLVINDTPALAGGGGWGGALAYMSVAKLLV